MENVGPPATQGEMIGANSKQSSAEVGFQNLSWGVVRARCICQMRKKSTP